MPRLCSSSTMRGKSVRWAPERIDRPDHVDVFLEGGLGDHLRGLADTRVDDFHASVAEGARDDLGTAVVAIEAGLGDEHLEGSLGHGSMVGQQPTGGAHSREALGRPRGRSLEVAEELGSCLLVAPEEAQHG